METKNKQKKKEMKQTNGGEANRKEKKETLIPLINPAFLAFLSRA